MKEGSSGGEMLNLAQNSTLENQTLKTIYIKKLESTLKHSHV